VGSAHDDQMAEDRIGKSDGLFGAQTNRGKEIFATDSEPTVGCMPQFDIEMGPVIVAIDELRG
jgi:hypothetical protein